MTRPDGDRRPAAQPHDDLDALFEVDHGMDDIFDAVRRDATVEDNNAPQAKEVTYGRKPNDDTNDVDEEIKITKKRAPIAKLDEKR
jgi:replication fork protection complex subunit Csm3/Swi3